MKPRSDSALAKLTDDQRDQLYDWLAEYSYREVIAMAAKSLPEGFGVVFHKTTLVRFYSQKRRDRHIEQLAVAIAGQSISADESKLIAETAVELAHAAYEMSQGPVTPVNFNNLSRALHRKETADLRRSQVEINQQQLALNKDRVALEQKRLELEIRHFEFNAAEQAARHATELKDITADSTLNDHDKYLAARNVLFGASSAPCPTASSTKPNSENL
jgi:hypothetical protein